VTYRIEVANSVDEVGAAEWAGLIEKRPFAHRRWFQFVESVLHGYIPRYLLVYERDELVAAATCCQQNYYYIPYLRSRFAKNIAQRLLHLFPLFSCENPMTEKSGLILRPGAANLATVQALSTAVGEEAHRRRAFFIGFDYLDERESALIGRAACDYHLSPLPPDTYLDISWKTFEEYVASLNYRKRKNVRRDIRQAAAQGYRVERWGEYAERGDILFPLVANVHRKHGEADIPVGPDVYVQAERLLPGSLVLAVYWHDQVVACELVFRDGDFLLPKLVGLNYQHAALAYSLLAYEEIRYAIESGARRIYMGTTGYEFKRRLGCVCEPRYYALSTRSNLLNALLRRMWARA